MRGLGVGLTVLVLAFALFAGLLASKREGFFDPVLYRTNYPCSLEARETPGPLDSDIESWFAAPLRSVGERPLWNAKTDGKTTLRFTFLPAFVEPVIVRIDDLYGPSPRLTATRHVDQVHVDAGPDHFVRNLSQEDVAPLIALISNSAVLDLLPDSCLVGGTDGMIYLIEASGPDGYRFINRWAVQEGEVYELANAMYRLTGWPNGRQGPERIDTDRVRLADLDES
jgi:hypothetical protein